MRRKVHDNNSSIPSAFGIIINNLLLKLLLKLKFHENNTKFIHYSINIIIIDIQDYLASGLEEKTLTCLLTEEEEGWKA